MDGTLSFDVTGLTISNIRQTRRTEEWSSLLVSMMKHAIGYVPRASVGFISNAACRYVDRQATKVANQVLFFEGASFHLEKQIAATAVLPEEILSIKLKAYAVALRAHRQEGTDLVKKIYGLRPNSAMGGAMVRMLKNLDQLAAAVDGMAFVATGQALEVAQQREAFMQLREKIRLADDSDIDADLLELAERASAAAEARDISADPDWARRMTQGPSH